MGKPLSGPINMVGQKFGMLTVLRENGRSCNRSIMWECICDCGKKVTIDGVSLRNRHTKSCGCYKKIKKAEMFDNHSILHKRIYQVWASMKDRCSNPNSQNYKWYGGKGIIVCEEWKNSFESFYKWALENGYKEDAKRGAYTLDRIDTNGNYEPSNCRFVNTKIQSRNKSTTFYLTHNGVTKSLADWSEEVGILATTIDSRIRKHGWSIEKALTTPTYSCGRRRKNGREKE